MKDKSPDPHYKERKPDLTFFLTALNSGGAEKNTVMLANFFSSKGYGIEMVLMQEQGAFLKDLDSRITVHALRTSGFLRALWRFRGYLEKHKPARIVAGLPAPNLIALIASRFSPYQGKVFLIQHHPFSTNAKEAKGIRSLLRTWLAKWLFPKAQKFIAVSEGVAEDLRQSFDLLKDKVTVIANPIDNARIKKLAVESLSDPWLEDAGTDFALMAGRLAPPKDYEVLLKAMTYLKSNLKLLICGEGPLKEDIKSLIRELGLERKVKLAGFQPNPYPYMAKARMTVLASRHEGFGNVLVESMALGTPVVASDCPGGPSEILGHGRYGELVSPGDPEALAEAMDKVYNGGHPDASMLKERAEKYDLIVIAKSYQDLLNMKK